MRRIKLLLMFLIPLATTSCHYLFTAPMLWRHQSSSAYDTWFGLWMLNVIFFGGLIFIVRAEWRRL